MGGDMPEKTLTRLLLLIIMLGLGHDVDHFIRDGGPQQLAFLLVLAVKYALIAVALFFYLRGQLGPLFWTIIAWLGVALAWLTHFSPFTSQTPQFIYRAYELPAAGALAVACLAALTITLIVTAIYAEYLWARSLPKKSP